MLLWALRTVLIPSFVWQAKVKIPSLRSAFEECSAKLALAKDAGQGAQKAKEVSDLIKGVCAKQQSLKNALFGRIANDNGKN